MNDDIMEAIFKQEQQRKDDEMFNNMQQLAFGNSSNDSILSATSITDPRTWVTTSATNLYATSTVGLVSSNTYNKKEVDDASLFMDNKLKILAVSTHSTYCNNMQKFDDTSAISSSYAITEYFNVIYNDNLLTPGSKCGYEINDTKNVVQHLNFLTKYFENIAHHKSSFPIGMIVDKWENLHKALI